MKGRRWMMVIVCVLALLTGQCFALEWDETLRDSLPIQSVEDAAPDILAGTDASDVTDLTKGLSLLWSGVKNQVGTILHGALRSGGTLLLIVLFCGMGEAVLSAGDCQLKQTTRLAGAGAVTLVALSDMHTLIGLGRDTITKLSDFVTILVPTLATAAAASGAAVSAPVRQSATLLFSNLLTRLISAFLLPLTYAYAATAVACAAMGDDRLKPLGKFLRWTVVTVLTGVMLAYVGYLTLAGTAAGTADAAAVRATQMAISGMVPVVGGILSDATETVLSGAALLRNSIGLFGVIGVLGFCAVPFLRLGAQYLLYKFVAALSAAASDHPAAGLIQKLGSVFSLVLAMTGCCALVALLSLMATISAVTP